MIRFNDIDSVIIQYCKGLREDPKIMATFFKVEISEYLEGKRKYEDLSLEAVAILKLVKKGRK